MLDKTIKDKRGLIDIKIPIREGKSEPVKIKKDSFIKVEPELVESLTIDYIDEYGCHRRIQPVNKQKDGTFLLHEDEFDKIKDDKNIKKLKLDKKVKIKKKDIDSKIVDIGLPGEIKNPKGIKALSNSIANMFKKNNESKKEKEIIKDKVEAIGPVVKKPNWIKRIYNWIKNLFISN